MRILLLNSSRRWGGTEHWACMAAYALAPEYDVHVAYRRETVGARFSLDKTRLPFLNEADVYTIAKLAALVRRRRIEVVISTKRKDYALGGAVARLTGAAHVIRLGIVRGLPDNPVNRLVYRAMCDGIVVNSQAAKDVLAREKYLARQRIAVIYNGVDDKRIEECLAAPAPARPASFVACAMGELTGRKDPASIMRGFARFVSNVPDSALVVIGDGPLKTGLTELAGDLGIAEKVVFTGFLGNPYSYLARSDVFVMASGNEGVANALMESMWLGVPPVTTRAGGAAEVVAHEKTGLLVPHGSPEGIAAALSRLHADSALRRSIGESARMFAREKFTVERMAREVGDFLAAVRGKTR